MVLTVEHLSKTFGDVEAVRDVSLAVDEGEFVSIVGPSGCGKSTLMEIVGGLIEPTAGRIDVSGMPGIVFQQESAFPWRTVVENVAFGLEMTGVGKAERLTRARDMIELVGLGGFEDRYPTELSGGMRQRVAIARTLVMEPKIILMDEPFGALDEQTRLILGEELSRIREATNATVLFITHSFDEALLLSDRIVVMTARPGTIKQVVVNPLPRPRDSTIVSDPEFGRLSGELWELLREESMRALAGERGR
ncbi:ABC transporter ATP-binding protein [Solirubrobacter phytolaccae]|uniref:ABC transporter ATP-binding protein n=1 Tax=Solirubrobacter phytolaccae TaxID=1404360 RepID=A0A9X3ND63_9ACTN|nr:ABC transporter ATP-binding protein [Solirubrobacter phytolaccae]MDA0182730.1 ABC transporter ATP-binding protein [Solirubrobacter phytolaccae]